MADNPYVNKVEYNGETLIDLTQDTVSAETLLSGVTAHLGSGASVTGTFDTTVFEEKANKVTSWTSTTTNTNYPSEKLVKDSLDGKQDSLPQTVNDRYLHTNSSTGALEWSEVQGGGGTWGSITGTLSDQTDLQNALDGKLDNDDVEEVTLAYLPTALSDLTDDSTHRVVTDTEKATWNNHVSNTSNPHSVTKAQVGLENVDNVQQYSASNPQGYIPYTTTTPTSANANGLMIAVLSSEPSTKYSGWLYLITG